ncbi:MAG: alpha/beta hydrolase [Pseudomonadota bacterium]
MLASVVDSWLASWAWRLHAGAGARARPAASGFSYVETPAGKVRCIDSGGKGPVVVFVPDGPNVVEHYQELIARMASSCRVICFDMPGFGFSIPGPRYAHSLDQGAAVVMAVLDHFGIEKATLAFSCANGFYALRVAALAPARVCGLVLSQTPSLEAMHAWTARIVPGVLRIPVVGQLFGWLFREKAALGWYRAALPRGADAKPFRDTARSALHCGGCFSLAGVVQGLLKEPGTGLDVGGVPCTLFWGKGDRSHAPTDPYSLLALVPHAEVIELDDCGHFPDLEGKERYVPLLMARADRWSGREINAFQS